jgi:hypothetical protein
MGRSKDQQLIKKTTKKSIFARFCNLCFAISIFLTNFAPVLVKISVVVVLWKHFSVRIDTW